MVREEVSRSGPLARVGAALMRSALRRLQQAHRLRRARRGAAAGRGWRGVDLPRRLQRHRPRERGLRRRPVRAARPRQRAVGRHRQHAALWESPSAPSPAAGAGGALVIRSRIIGTGRAVPARVLTNDDLAQDGRHLRRLDHGADRHPPAPHPGGVTGRQRPGGRGGAVGLPEGRRRSGDGGLHHRRDGHRRLSVPGHGDVRAEEAGRRRRRLRLRSVGRLRGVPLRRLDRRRVHPGRPVQARCW